jgi:hypothetical protein
LGSLFTHNEPGALLTGVNDNRLSADAWKDLRVKRGKAHEPAHFHAIYGEYEALIEIDTLMVCSAGHYRAARWR